MNLEDHVLSNTKSVTTSSKAHSLLTLIWWPISRESCCIVYALLIFLMILTAAIRSFTFVSVCMTASINLHDKMFNALTRATIYFFNTNSSGMEYFKLLTTYAFINIFLPFRPNS